MTIAVSNYFLPANSPPGIRSMETEATPQPQSSDPDDLKAGATLYARACGSNRRPRPAELNSSWYQCTMGSLKTGLHLRSMPLQPFHRLPCKQARETMRGAANVLQRTVQRRRSARESGSQQLEVDGGRCKACKVGLDLQIGEATADGTRGPVDGFLDKVRQDQCAGMARGVRVIPLPEEACFGAP
jgi:hypothetical protein